MNSTTTAEEYHEEFLRFLNESYEMKKTAKHSLRHGLYAGGGAFAGAVALGPVGGLIGGCVGSVVGYINADNYDGVVQGMLKLDDVKRKAVLKEAVNVLMTAGARVQQISTTNGFRETLFDFVNHKSIRDQLWKIIRTEHA